MKWFFFLLFFSVSILSAEEDLLKKADNAYLAGERAETLFQRQENFNAALAIYTQLEKTYHPTYGNGKLYYDIANTYYQLGEYSWAVLYYYRALKLMPKDPKAHLNLETTLQQLGLPHPEWPSFFQTGLSLAERLQLFFLLGVLFFTAASLYLWRPHRWVKNCCILFAILAALILLDLTYDRYFMPVEAVIVKSAALFRDAGEQYAKISTTPLLGGTKVQVLEVLQDGKWLKVLAPSGELGYLPYTFIQII